MSLSMSAKDVFLQVPSTPASASASASAAPSLSKSASPAANSSAAATPAGTTRRTTTSTATPNASAASVEEKTETAATTAHRVARFEEWLRRNGAEFPALEIRTYGAETSDVRGVHATCAVPPHTTVVSVPLRCLITDVMGRTDCELGRLAFAPDAYAHFSSPAIIAVVLYVLETMRDENHFFAPYYDMLPRDYSFFPVFWSDANAKAWLRGSPVLQDLKERKRALREDYDEVCRVVPGFAHRFPYDEFLKVRSAVGSRNFGIVVDGQKCTSLVPFADLLNHLRPRETTWTFDSTRDCFTITTLTRLDAGQPVFDSYGRKSNARFLLHYGFTVEDNREDGISQNELAVRVRLPGYAVRRARRKLRARRAALGSSLLRNEERTEAEGAEEENDAVAEGDADAEAEAEAQADVDVDANEAGGSSDEEDEEDDANDEAEWSALTASSSSSAPANGSSNKGKYRDDPLEPMRLAILGTRRPSRKVRVTMSRLDKGTSECLCFARVAVATEDELDSLTGSMGRSLTALRFVSARNEVAAVRFIAKAMQARLRRYAASLEDNIALLHSGSLAPFSPQRSALILVIGEQEIATFWVRLAEVLETALASGAVAKLASLPQTTHAERDVWRYACWFASMLLDEAQSSSALATATSGTSSTTNTTTTTSASGGKDYGGSDSEAS